MQKEDKGEDIEVSLPKVQHGEVKFFKQGFLNPTPEKLKRVLTAIRYTLVSLITMFAATDLLSPYQIKITTFVLGVAVLICGAIELGTGVKPLPDEPTKPNNI